MAAAAAAGRCAVSGAAEAVIADAVLAALRAAPELAALNRIGSGEGERSPVPYAWIAEVSGADWGAKDRPGREVRLVLVIADRGEGARLDGLCAAVMAVLTALPRPIEGWDHAGARAVRARMTQRRDGLRLASIEVRVRVLGAE